MRKLIIKINKKISKGDRALVGGKGLPLVELSTKQIPVPDGFIVTTEAFDYFLQENNLHTEIKKLVLKRQFKTIQKLIEESPIPEDLFKEIKAAVSESNIEKYAVRSSANVEDSKLKSWAGEFDTYLNVSKKNVVDNIKKCWASIFNPRAVNYAGSLSKLLSIKMAVVVQINIDSKVSGVCFTADPLDAGEDDIKIEAVFGLGESLVQGEVTPDKYTVERKRNIILEVFVTPQEMEHVSKRGGGTKINQIKPSYKQKLSGKEIKEFSKLAQKIEKLYKNGQDIEWCKDKTGKIYILQSRPITTGLD